MLALTLTLYLATVIDLFSRRVVGWALSARIGKELVIDAMNKAITNERPLEGLIFHSDRGSQYASYAFRDLLSEKNIQQSMSAKGDCYDNACAESFFATIKKELIHRRRFSTRSEATLAVVNYVVCWYNPHRIHSLLGDMSPQGYEQNYYKGLLAVA
ncbi:MAG: IS3 family transposase [Limnochordia bacterium]|nr:IS3 family transposase [Limnochordia bacterium]